MQFMNDDEHFKSVFQNGKLPDQEKQQAVKKEDEHINNYDSESILNQTTKIGSNVPIKYSDFLDVEYEQPFSNLSQNNNYINITDFSGQVDQNDIQTQASLHTRKSSQLKYRRSNLSRIYSSNSSQSSTRDLHKFRGLIQPSAAEQEVQENMLSRHHEISRQYQQNEEKENAASQIVFTLNQQNNNIHSQNQYLNQSKEKSTSHRTSRSSNEELRKQLRYLLVEKENQCQNNRDCKYNQKMFEPRSSLGGKISDSPEIKKKEQDMMTKSLFSFQKAENSILQKEMKIVNMSDKEKYQYQPSPLIYSNEQVTKRQYSSQQKTPSHSSKRDSQINSKRKSLSIVSPNANLSPNITQNPYKLEVGTQVSRKSSQHQTIQSQFQSEQKQNSLKKQRKSTDIQSSQKIERKDKELRAVSVQTNNDISQSKLKNKQLFIEQKSTDRENKHKHDTKNVVARSADSISQEQREQEIKNNKVIESIINDQRRPSFQSNDQSSKIPSQYQETKSQQQAQQNAYKPVKQLKNNQTQTSEPFMDGKLQNSILKQKASFIQLNPSKIQRPYSCCSGRTSQLGENTNNISLLSRKSSKSKNELHSTSKERQKGSQKAKKCKKSEKPDSKRRGHLNSDQLFMCNHNQSKSYLKERISRNSMNSNNYITYLIQPHSSQCKNIRKELSILLQNI